MFINGGSMFNPLFLTLILLPANFISSSNSQATTTKTNELDGENQLFGEHQHNCSCGRHVRNTTSVKFVAGKKYDTIFTVGDGMDAKVVHAYSPALNRCVAIKRCEEDRNRLNKCTRELEVMKALNAMERANYSTGRSHFAKLIDYEVQENQSCSEDALFSDFVHMIVVGSDRRRRKRRELENSNCSLVHLVEELGDLDLLSYWRKNKMTKINKTEGEQEKEFQSSSMGNESLNLNQQIVGEVEQGLEQMHSMGIAHRDVHPDNVLLVRPQPFATASTAALPEVKLIDFGWSCCFQPAKCGTALAKLLPLCEEKEALADDKFGLNDVRRTANQENN